MEFCRAIILGVVELWSLLVPILNICGPYTYWRGFSKGAIVLTTDHIRFGSCAGVLQLQVLKIYRAQAAWNYQFGFRVLANCFKFEVYGLP